MSELNRDTEATEPAVDHARLLEVVFGSSPVGLSPEQEQEMLHNALIGIRDFSIALSTGDLHRELPVKGPLAGALKSLAANLRHLTWQVSAIAAGDLSQRVDFLGEFSEAFNGMTEQLGSTLAELRERDRELSAAHDELKIAHSQLMELSTRDPLTGLLNRRSLEDRWVAEKARADRSGEPICVIVADLDKFKDVNDTWGHAAGDAVLIGFAEQVTQSLRTSDLVFRTGGDEFLILLPATASTGCSGVATRICDAFSSCDLGPALEKCEHTGSFGIAEYPRHGTTLEDLVSAADEALYRVKAGGRNYVAVAKG